MSVPVELEVNGTKRGAEVEPSTLLVDFLRENLGLTGTHVGCESTACGACTVLLDGRAVKSCAVLAVQAAGRKVTTVEGMGSMDELSSIQFAFWKKHGLQCGFCTPGMIISAHGLLQQNDDPDESEIRRALSGNLCRCTGYVKIIESVKYAAKLNREGKTVFKGNAKRRWKSEPAEHGGEGW
jgi:aerobic carbon-monoxide dehydrogenase small subunit